MGNFLGKLIYFFLVILLFGTAGIWVPAVIDLIIGNEFNEYGLYQKCTTYFIPLIIIASLSLTSKIVQGTIVFKMNYILLLILIIVVSMLAVIFSCIAIVKEWELLAFWIPTSGVATAWVLWWVSNWNNDQINPSNALGGNP